MRLKIALTAFFAILKGRKHIYSNGTYTSFVGNEFEVCEMIDDISILYNEVEDEDLENEVLNEAKDILNKHDGV